MLFRVDESARTAEEITASSFGELAVKERLDIQEWVIACPRLLGEDLLVVTDEFDQFDRTSERLDVLAVDRSGKLVVVELKRTAVGTRAELQALRYAAYCSTLSLDDIAELYAGRRRGTEGDLSVEEARAEILEFVEDPDFEEFDDQPRIAIAAEGFPPEMTATILWLRSFEMDISAVRLRPYRVDAHLLVDSSVLIPLPEAEEYIIRRERKDSQQAGRARGKGAEYLVWFQDLLDELRERHGFTTARKAQPQNWYSFASGHSGVRYGAVFAREGLRAEVYLDGGNRDENKRIFDALFSEREALESRFDEPVSWERMDESQASRIGLYLRGLTIRSPQEERDEGRRWMVRQLLKLKEVFGPRMSTGILGGIDHGS